MAISIDPTYHSHPRNPSILFNSQQSYSVCQNLLQKATRRSSSTDKPCLVLIRSDVRPKSPPCSTQLTDQMPRLILNLLKKRSKPPTRRHVARLPGKVSSLLTLLREAVFKLTYTRILAIGRDLCGGYYFPTTDASIKAVKELDAVINEIKAETAPNRLAYSMDGQPVSTDGRLSQADLETRALREKNFDFVTRSVSDVKRNVLVLTIEGEGNRIQAMKQAVLSWDEVKDVSIDNITARNMSDEWLRDHHQTVLDAYHHYIDGPTVGGKAELNNAVDVFSEGATNWALFGSK